MAYVKANEVPENYDRYPEFTMFGELPAWGFFMRHVKGVTLRGVTLTLRDRDFRPAICQIDVEGYKDEGLKTILPEKKHCGKCHHNQK